MTLRVALVTPTVDRSGGTEKCMSWLVEDLSRRCELTVFTSRVADTDTSRARVVRVPGIRRPRLLRFVVFAALSPIIVWFGQAVRRSRYDHVLSTSGDCVIANVIHAHFCCAAWLDLLRHEHVRMPSSGVRQRLRNAHYLLFLRLAAIAERWAYRRGDGPVIAVSEGVKRDIQRWYRVPSERMEVIPNPVDDRVRPDPTRRASYRAAVRTELRIPSEELALLFVGAGDWKRKNLSVVIDALALLRAEPLRLIVLGSEDPGYYSARADRLGVAERVIFCGFRRDIERYYAAADLFVYPSAYEAFSLVSLEAAGAGLPLIVTKVNGTDELVDDGVNGMFVTPDASDVADKVRRLVRDPALRRRMGEAAAATAGRYSRENVADRFMAVLTRGTSDQTT